MKALKRTLIILAILLAFGLMGTLGGYAWYRHTHVKVDGVIYSTNTKGVDLRGQDATLDQVKALRQALPHAVVIWDIPFQGQRLPEDTQELTVTELTMEDVEALAFLPGLTQVHAEECRDYEALLALEQQKPDCQVDFKIHLGDMALERDTDQLTLPSDCGVTAQELKDALQYLPDLKEIFLEDPTIPAQELYALQGEYENITMDWNKKFLDQVYGTDLKELEIIGENPGTIQQLEDTLEYFPNFEKIYLDNAGYTNDELAALREKKREQYQVIWMVYLGEGHLRTDDVGFIPSNSGWRIPNEEIVKLKYCEGLLAVDIGHTNTGNLEWVTGTPHLKYLIVGDGNVFNKDVAHLGCLKELEWLEIFNCPVTDVSSLKGCTGLKDLLLSGCYVDVTPLGEMTWLENLWLSGSGLKYAEKEYLAEHLPNTYIMSAGNGGHGHGWRNLPRYFEMRDTLGMWYMKG